jgi:hypothetical protein
MRAEAPAAGPRDVEAWTAQLGRALAAVHAAPLEGRDASVLPDDDWRRSR